MLMNTMLEEVAVAVNGKIIKSLEFKSRGVSFYFQPGQNIIVDMDTHICLIEGNHYQLDLDDYEVSAN